MANAHHLRILKYGVHVWNQWRKEHPDTHPDLSSAELDCADLREADLAGAYLHGAHLRRANLARASFDRADLHNACLVEADLHRVNFSNGNLDGADLRSTNLHSADFFHAVLHNANLTAADINRAVLYLADLRGAQLGFTYGLTQAQVEIAVGDLETELPMAYISRRNGKSRPEFHDKDQPQERKSRRNVFVNICQAKSCKGLPAKAWAIAKTMMGRKCPLLTTT